MPIDKNTSDTPASRHDVSPSPSPSLWAKIKTHKLILIIILVIFIVVAIALVLINKNKSTNDQQTNNSSNNQGSQGNQSIFMQQYGQNCKQRDITFSSAPMNMNELSYIRPLGAVNDGHVTPTDHVYIGGPNPNAADNTYPVLMPADGTITQVSAMPAQYIGDKQGQQVAPEDHRIAISHSCRYFSIYIHIHKLSDTLKAAVGSLQPNENKQVAIDLKAGETVGYIGSSTFDWTPIDTSKTLTGFITPKLYEGESWKIHTVSPFDLYQGSLKTELENKSLRSTPPIGGKIDYDQPGKLIGTWFREGSGGYSGSANNNEGRYWDGHLSVAPDYISPSSTIVSIGNWNGSAKQMVVSGTVDPAAISKDNGIVKYELKRLSYVTKNGASSGNMYEKDMHPSQNESLEGVILFQVLPGEKLEVEKFPGKTAAQVGDFTSAAQIYER
jgi:hypothetical protein